MCKKKSRNVERWWLNYISLDMVTNLFQRLLDSTKNHSERHYLQMEKRKKKKTQHIAKLPRLADLLKFLQKHIDGSSRKSQKTQRQHRRSCSFSCINKGHCSYIHNPILAKKDIHGRVVRRKPLLSQKNNEAHLHLMMKYTPWWFSNLLGQWFVGWLIKSVTVWTWSCVGWSGEY